MYIVLQCYQERDML